MIKLKPIQEDVEEKLGRGAWERYSKVSKEIVEEVWKVHENWLMQGKNIYDLQGSRDKMISLIGEAIAKHEKAVNQ
jgi:hypothetical protein